MLPVCRGTGDAGPKAASPALPFLGQLVPAQPCKGADRALHGYAQGLCRSSWTMPEGPTGQGTYTGPLETSHGPLQNSPNGCCISPHQHHHVAATSRLQKQASHDSSVQKRGSMSPVGNNVETHSTPTGFRAVHSSRNNQQHLRSATTGSRPVLHNSTGVFQTPAQVTAAGPISPPAHDPAAPRAIPSCHSQQGSLRAAAPMIVPSPLHRQHTWRSLGLHQTALSAAWCSHMVAGATNVQGWRIALER